MHTQVKQKRKTSLGRRIHLFWVYLKRHPLLYLMLIPGLFFLFIYKFWPLYGIQMAFRKYNMFAGKNPMDAIAKSPWVGWTNFEKLFRSAQFGMVVKNTLIINGMKILFLFPLPIVTAILLNEIRKAAAKRFMQTVIYVPYFFSWVMIYGIFFSLLGTYGVINNLSASLGGTRTSFFTSPLWFRWLLVFTEGWREVGYNTVIYMAAIAGIDTVLYEAAKVDGANKWQQIWHVTIPGILPTIVLLLILKVGYILDTGFEQVLIFYNPVVYDVGDIIQTYVYRLGMNKMDYARSTAMGLFNSIVAFILIVGANTVSRKTLHRSIW